MRDALSELDRTTYDYGVRKASLDKYLDKYGYLLEQYYDGYYNGQLDKNGNVSGQTAQYILQKLGEYLVLAEDDDHPLDKTYLAFDII